MCAGQTKLTRVPRQEQVQIRGHGHRSLGTVRAWQQAPPPPPRTLFPGPVGAAVAEKS